MGDVFDKCRTWMPLLDHARAEGLYAFHVPTRARRAAAVAEIGGREVVMAGGSDYLGLACDPRVIGAAAGAAARLGAGCGGSRLANGSMEPHEELEERLATFLGCEAAAVTTTGYQASLALAALFDGDDVVHADRLNHASLVDGLRLSRATVRRYRHLDVEGLARLLGDGAPAAGRAIVTDGVFSMSGDAADLAALADLRDRHGARLVVDASHDIGVLGAGGRGLAEHAGVADRVDLTVCTLSKAFGSLGGVLAGPREVVSFLRHTANSVLFAAALPPASTAAALTALDIMAAEPWRRERALRAARLLREGLRERGHDVADHPSTVIAVPMGDTETCGRYFAGLLEEGVFVTAAYPPAVPSGAALLRLGASAAFTDTHIERVLDAFAAVGRRLGRVPALA